jgi:hypothetical protein
MGNKKKVKKSAIPGSENRNTNKPLLIPWRLGLLAIWAAFLGSIRKREADIEQSLC